MRIVFVDNLLLEYENGRPRYICQPHLGLISLIAMVERAGHEGILVDPKLSLLRGELALDESLYQGIARAVIDEQPDVVGLTTLGCNFICTLKVASWLKQWSSKLPILLGGPHATVLDREILERFPQFDLIVRNEAELKINPLLEVLPDEDYESVSGVTWRNGSEIVTNPGDPFIENLDDLPIPAYDKYPIRELGLASIRVDAGRGCPFACTFCSTASFFGRKYRLKSSVRLLAELDHLNSEYGITDFALTHDLFTVNRQKVAEFCRTVMGKGYTWKCSARMDCVDRELLRRMSAAGCRSIYYGIETGSPRMQKVSQKHLDLSLFTTILEATYQVGMTATVSFITGYPEEEQEDQDQTLDLIGSCFYREQRPLNVQLHLLTPEPGTKLIRDYANQLEYDGHIADFNFPTLEDDDAEIMERNPAIFMNHHYYRAALPRQRHVFITSIYQVLYRLGFTVLAHLLECYSGRLSVLMKRMSAWAEETGAPRSCDEKFVCSFLAAAHGADHYFVSLARYLFDAVSLSTVKASGVEAQTVSPTGHSPVRARRYSLTPSAAILRNLHNCPEILACLEAAPESCSLPGELLVQRGNYLLFCSSETGGTVRNFELDEISTLLLEYLTKARTSAQFLRYGSDLAGEIDSPKSFFEGLLNAGVLIPSGHVATGDYSAAAEASAAAARP